WGRRPPGGPPPHPSSPPPPPANVRGGRGRGGGGCSYRCRPIEIRSNPPAAGITRNLAASRGSHGWRAISSRGGGKSKSSRRTEPIVRDRSYPRPSSIRPRAAVGFFPSFWGQLRTQGDA